MHYSTARHRLGVCGRRWGKSLSAAKEAEFEILKPEGTLGWIVAPTYDLTNKVFREIWKELIVKQKMPTKRKSERDRYIEFAWGSIVEGKSADSPDSLVGEGLDYLIMDEAAKIKKRIYEQYLRPTLSDKIGWDLKITTPEGFNWIYDIFLKGQSPDHPDFFSIQSSTYDNPYVKDSEIDSAKLELTKEYFEQEYMAQFTSFAGKVYPFDRNTHVKKLDFNKEWETYCSIDFGFRMPSVGWYQVGKVVDKETKQSHEEVHLIDEISHEKNIKTEDLADRIKAKTYPNVTYYGDPAGVGVQAQSGLGDIEIFRRRGLIVRYTNDPMARSISTGVGIVRKFFEDAEGKTHFYISNRCLGHIVDYEGYRYPERKEDRALKEEPLKDGYHDHGCDETRYFFINRFPIRDRIIRGIR